jgi:hypothetical protein
VGDIVSLISLSCRHWHDRSMSYGQGKILLDPPQGSADHVEDVGHKTHTCSGVCIQEEWIQRRNVRPLQRHLNGRIHLKAGPK